MTEQSMTEESIFATVLELKTESERQAYLDRACAGNPELRAQIEGLLKANADAGSFLNHPPLGLNATIEVTHEGDTASSGGWAGGMPFLEPCETPGCIGKLVGKSGEYEIIEVVGQGGMGAVLRAFETKLSRIVAVKVMAPELAANPNAVKRFLREAQSAAAVHHDHVVTIHAIDETHRPPFLVMQFIEGQTLQQKLDREGALPLAQILRIGSQMAAGLAAAHKLGLIHRDVKPANVLLENGVERVKITDFGLARAADDLEMTQTGMIAGTPQYMSPEQARGEPIDSRSDLFSLGSVLYSMSAGRPAFRAANTMAVLRRVCDESPRPIREVNPDIPAWLEAIVSKLLAKDPAHRFSSAAEVAETLAQHLAHLQNPAQIARPATVFVPPPQKADFAPPPSSTAPVPVLLIALAAVLALPLVLVALAVGGWFFYSSGRTPPGNAVVDYEPFLPDDGQTTELVEVVEAAQDEPGEADPPDSPLSPPQAVAPFDAAAAAAHQQAWADYLDVPLEYTSPRGMRFRLIPPGEYIMGRSEQEVQRLEALYEADWERALVRSQMPERAVTIRKPFYLAIHELTLGEFQAFVTATDYQTTAEASGRGSVRWSNEANDFIDDPMLTWKTAYTQPPGNRVPVLCVTPADATALVKWLGEADGLEYSLPRSDAWEYACRAGTATLFWTGDSDQSVLPHEWVAVDSQPYPVGTKSPNPFGLFDMHGNVHEWAINHEGVAEERGGYCRNPASYAHSANRVAKPVPRPTATMGLRLSLSVASVQRKLNVAPMPALAPFTAAQADAHQQAWAEHLGLPVEYENSVGMKFNLIPPGEFLMGMTQEETDALARDLEQGGANELDKFVANTLSPRHRVLISRPFFLGAYEVTVGQYRQFVAATNYIPTLEQLGVKRFHWTSAAQEPNAEERAVIGVSWDDAREFCQWLSKKEGRTYGLPTEAQWEYACRAGTETGWSFGDGAGDLALHAVFGRPSFWPAEVVGSKQPNPFGLFDMHGNADEWCLDWHSREFYARSPAVDPVCLEKPTDKNSGRVARSGTALSAPWRTRSTIRGWDFPAAPVNPKGFRVAIVGGLSSLGKSRPAAAVESPSDQPVVISRSSRVFTGALTRDGDQNVFALAWSPDGALAATGHFGGAVAIWNLASGEQLQSLKGHTETVNAVAFAPGGKLLATGGEDSQIRLWHAPAWDKVVELSGHTGRVNALAFLGEGNRLASVSWDFESRKDNSIRLWNVSERSEEQKFLEPLGHNTQAALSPDQKLMAVANAASARVRLWDLAAGSPTHDFEGFPTQPVSAAFSRDGTRVAAGYMGRERDDGEWNDPENAVVRMWDVKSGKLLQEFKGHAGPVMCLEFSPDDRHLLSVANGRHDVSGTFVQSSDHSLRIWDVASGSELARIEPQSRVNVARWTPDGSGICSGTRLWAVSPWVIGEAKAPGAD